MGVGGWVGVGVSVPVSLGWGECCCARVLLKAAWPCFCILVVFCLGQLYAFSYYRLLAGGKGQDKVIVKGLVKDKKGHLGRRAAGS